MQGHTGRPGVMKRVTFLSCALLCLLILPMASRPDASSNGCESFLAAEPLWAADAPQPEELQDIDLGTASLEDFVLFICRVLDVQVVYDKQIFQSGAKYMFKFKPQPVGNLFPLLRDTLDLYGYSLLSMGDENKPVYYIFKKDQPTTFKIPPPDVVPSGGAARADKVMIRFVKLRYADAGYLVNQLKALPGVDPKSLQAYPPTNEVAIIDFPDRVKYYEGLICDRDIEDAKLRTVVVELRHVKSAFLLDVVKQHLAAVALVSEGKQGGPPGGALAASYRSPVEFTAVEEPNKIIFTAPEHEASRIEEFIRKLDVEIKTPEKEIITEIYALKHIDLEEAAEIVAKVFGSHNITVNNGQPVSAEKKPAEENAEQPSKSEYKGEPEKSGNFDLEEFEVPTVVVQKHTTSLVVTTSRRIHEKMKALLKVLDIKTPQVFIEAALVSVGYDTDLTVATELSTIQMLHSGPQVFSATDFGLSKLTPVPNFTLSGRTDFRKGGLVFGVAKDNANVIPGLVRLSRTTSKVKVLSNPSVFADNNREAVFSTTDQQAFSQTVDTASGTTITTQGGVETASIEIKIKPTIFEGETLRLEITLKVEAFTAPPANVNLSPPKTSNVYTGILSVADGKTIIVGGLVTNDEHVTETKVPVLGDIPLLGYLFKSQTKTKGKSVLYIFITPRIMKEAGCEDIDKLRQEKQNQLDELNKGGK